VFSFSFGLWSMSWCLFISYRFLSSAWPTCVSSFWYSILSLGEIFEKDRQSSTSPFCALFKDSHHAIPGKQTR
jgi:hypothetical protein